MIIISARENFNNPDRLLENGHITREINLQTNQKIDDGISLSTLLERIKDKKVLILVHGYNNEQEEVFDAYETIENKVNENLEDVYDLIIGYSWPGGDDALDWWRPKRRSNAVARRFRFLLEQLSSASEFIDLMSHSLGARVCLKALKESNTTDLIRDYYCKAPDVDNECLEVDEEFYQSIFSCGRLFVFHSRKDEVLATAYRLAEFDNALGLFGPEDKDYIENEAERIYVVNCKHKVTSHGGYKRSDAVYQYISDSLDKDPNTFVTLR